MAKANITINPDGYSIKGCSIIYPPAGQAGEYARLATNPYRGCGNGCVYCYVPSVIQMDRSEFNEGAEPRKDFLMRLAKDATKYQAIGCAEQVMLSFTTDPYHPGDTSLTRTTLEVLRACDLRFCTLTKGGKRALRDIDLFRPDRDAFASTLTTLDEAESLRWEPRAAVPSDRMATLREFHAARIFTWVSLEPVFNTEATIEIIRQTHRYVDLFKIGRINYSKLTHLTNWRQFTARVLEVLKETGAGYFIKKDLQPYLPQGFPNVQYQRQSKAVSSAA
jgi:DNA repair photolyase